MKIIRFLIMLLLPLCCKEFVSANNLDSIGSTQFCCIYQHYVRTTTLDDEAVIDSTITILEVGDNIAKYGDYSVYQGQKPSGYSCGFADGDPRMNDGIAVYQDFPQKGKVTVREGLLPNFYIYEEQLGLDWNLVEGQDTILGYKCDKAIAKYGGRTWLVYYTGEIPAVYGPWKLLGLPGLILKAESEDGIHKFVAQVLFNIEAQQITFDKMNKDVYVKRDKFISLRNRLKTDKRWAKNAGYYINKSDIKSLTIIRKNNKVGLAPGMNINGINLPISGGFEHLYKPLELQ